MPHGVAEEATAVVGFANHKDFMEWFSSEPIGTSTVGFIY
jgi:helicase SWR1